MKRTLPFLFAALGLLDLLYGLFFDDRVSIIVGLVIIGIAAYILKKRA
ncbi:MAG: hypothetical protein U5R30_11710 [Deltaproteobacteria bacterium]|jgi:hypothetical protein|nr:hypothetical protein [Deltaproteobacteria bacterium]